MTDKRHSTRKARRRGIAMLTMAALTLLAVRGSGLAIGQESDDKPTAESTATIDLSANDHRLVGLVEPSRVVKIGAPLDGRIVELAVADNDVVDKDAPLVKLDAELQENQLEAAQMEVDRRQMLLKEADIQLDRIKALEERRAAQPWEVRQAQLNRDVADLEVHRAEQAVKQEQARLARYTIKAPFSGRVIRIESEVGAALRISEPILTVVKLDELEARMFAPVELYDWLKVGQKYRFMAGAPVRRELVGTLKTVEPLIDDAGGTFRATFTIDNADGSLPAGFSARFIWPQ